MLRHFLDIMIDFILKDGILKCLDEDLKNRISLQIVKQTDSTNALVKARASCSDEGLVVIAEKQTSGRGRMGRSFFSPDGTGIYMSLLLKPRIKGADAVQITTAAAVALCRAFERAGAEDAGIKWVNDIFAGGKKVCGILTEGALNPADGTLDYAVLGVGINVYPPSGGFPEDIENIAGALFGEERENLRNFIIGEFLNEFFALYGNISEKAHSREYAQRCIVTGKNVTVIRGNEIFSAFCESIDEDCGLNIVLPDGKRKTLTSGEISLRM